MFALYPDERPKGILAIHDSLIPHSQLSRACGELHLTTPVIHTTWKLCFQQQLTPEELEIVPSLLLKRGPKDWSKAPMVHGKLDSDSGILSTLDGLRLANVLPLIPPSPQGVTKVDEILFSTYIRLQALSVLWDLADGISKGHRFGSPKPWVVQELQILGLISVGEPIPDGSTGRPPQRLVINSWGRQLVECTRKYMGVEITEDHQRMGRRRSGNRKQQFSRTDLLASGYLARGQEIPEKVLNRMSAYGKEELSKVHGVEL